MYIDIFIPKVLSKEFNVNIFFKSKGTYFHSDSFHTLPGSEKRPKKIILYATISIFFVQQ